MNEILCFGDSNTYGFNPKDFNRHNEKERWSGILKQNFNVIECGCNNRTIFNNSNNLNSILTLPKYLNNGITHIILQIGINDLQTQYNTDLKELESKLTQLIKSIDKEIKIILLCPSLIDKCILNSNFAQLFNSESIEKSKKLPEIYKNISKQNDCTLVNLNNIATVSKIDGLHYDIENHKLIADYLSNILN
ncbi:MAG: hypothetical protein IKU37_05380 [Candidatus Gastranaerophilales bacterium]|nr:hypothetical protein [Candidatus Gastranaerophilales bacterium]